MDDFRAVTYTENERNIVRSGITAIQKILMGTDPDRKQSLLSCLDWFMDPYYGQDISDIHESLIELLETVIISPNEDDVIEDAIGLLTDYESPPFHIIERNMDLIPSKFMKDILYLLNENSDK